MVRVCDIEGALVGFDARKFKLPDAIWVSSEFSNRDCNNPYEEFSERFSYIAINDQDKCFAKLSPLETHVVRFEAERYGGRGVGANGGGGRCGNFQGVQIKGVGRNQLVGTTNKFYSYGGLNARDAVYEAIYGSILNHLLPVGTAKIFGVIFTSPDGAYNKYDENSPDIEELGWGALLVREICLRPGHFFRSQFFTPNKSSRLSKDTIRVKQVNTSLFRNLGSTEACNDYLETFLTNCANQFSYAKVFRITHGGIYPSNICFDGRWIDLTNASFICGGKNIGGCPPFFEETDAIASILREFIHTFTKYNNFSINISYLEDLYNRQLTFYFNFHVVSLFSISYEKLDESTKNDALGYLSEQVSAVLHSDPKLILCWPDRIDDSDPVVLLQEALFISLANQDLANEKLLQIKNIKGFKAETVLAAFTRVAYNFFHSTKTSRTHFYDFFTVMAISSLKKSLFVEFFYKGRLSNHINSIIYSTPFEARRLIVDAISISDWIFESIENGGVRLYEGNNLTLGFDSSDEAFYSHCMLTGSAKRFLSVSDLVAEVNELSSERLTIQGYNFKSNILKILKTIDLLRR